MYRRCGCEAPLTFDHFVLLGVKVGGVVLEMLDQGPGSGLIEDFATIRKFGAAAHRMYRGLWKSMVRGSSQFRGSAAAKAEGAWMQNRRVPSVHTQRLADRSDRHNRHRPNPAHTQPKLCRRGGLP